MCESQTLQEKWDRCLPKNLETSNPDITKWVLSKWLRFLFYHLSCCVFVRLYTFGPVNFGFTLQFIELTKELYYVVSSSAMWVASLYTSYYLLCRVLQNALLGVVTNSSSLSESDSPLRAHAPCSKMSITDYPRIHLISAYN